MPCLECRVAKGIKRGPLEDFLEKSQLDYTSIESPKEEIEVVFIQAGFDKISAFKSSSLFETINIIDEIDWDEQSKRFSPYYQDDGLIKICLDKTTRNKKELFFKLFPGGGFGDGSHPSTRLILKMMLQEDFRNKKVIDIGAGSGILSFAASSLGAKEVIGSEVDPCALDLAAKNRKLNQYTNIGFFYPQELFQVRCEIVLMNMISSRQSCALKDEWLETVDIVLVSGLLIEEEKAYLSTWKKKGWGLVEANYEDIWSCYKFQREEEIENNST